MSEQYKEMAARIRELREICEISPAELANELGVSLPVYQGWESNGQDVPISALYHMAQRFKVDINEILTGSAPHLQTYSVVRRGKGREISRYPEYRFHSLAYTYSHKIMEPLLVTLEEQEKPPKLVTHNGQEFNLVLEGQVELLFDDKSVLLGEGDCVYFNPTHPHGQRAVGGRTRFLTVIAE